MTWREFGGTLHVAVRGLAGGRLAPAFHDPAAALPLQRVAHLHARCSAASLGAERNRGVRFVLPEGDRGDLDLHGSEIQIRALRKIVEDALPNRFGGLRPATATQQ